MFILLRRIERWLHQHIFKVGWLITQNYQTTTIFYYTIFLPGVVLHELVYWLAAGMLNVRADRAIKWPEPQEVGELKLNFVHINPKAHIMRKAVITIAPLLVGLLCIWYIAHNIFDITAVFNRMSSGNLYDVGAAFQMLMAAPLFWLWVYIIFTIANTMYPSIPKDLQGWRSVLLGLATVSIALLLLGLGGEIFDAIKTPLGDLIFVLQATFILMIAIDVLMVLVLGLIEYTIESTTGNSATFRGGKMITMTREEAIEERRKQRELEQKEQAKKRNPAADTGIASIYMLPFSIPGIPPQEPVTLLREHSQSSIEVPAVVVEEPQEKKPAATMPLFGGIAATAGDEPKPLSDEQKAQRESIAAKINMPERLSPAKSEEKAASDKPKEEESAEEKPAAPLGTFSKPAITSPKDGETVGTAFMLSEEVAKTKESEEAEGKPVTSRFGGFNKPAITSPKDEDEAEEKEAEEKPAASRFGSFTKPAITSPKEEDEAVDKEAEEKPVASRFGSYSKPAISTPKDEDEAEDKEAEERHVASRFDGFSKPAITSPKDEDEAEGKEAEGKPVASRFGGFSKPAITSPKEGETVGTASMLSEEPAKTEEAEETEEKPVASRFGGFSKPAVTSPKEDDEAKEEAKPATSRFSFSKPASDDEAKPAASRFGASPFKPVGEEKPEEKPAASASRFASTEFHRIDSDEEEGEKPASPFGKPSSFGTSRPAPKTFGKEEDESEDDEDEEVSRPSSPILGRPSAFGTSRPAPKTFGKDEDEGEDKEDEEVSRPSSPILGRSSAFGTSRPAPKTFGSKDEDEDEPEDDEEAPRSRISGFGLLGKRPKDADISYEDDEDDFRNFSDDDDDYNDSDDED